MKEGGNQGGAQALGLSNGWMATPFMQRGKLRFVGKTMDSDLDILIWRSLIQVECPLSSS